MIKEIRQGLKISHKSFVYLIFIALLICFSACQHKEVYYQFREINKGEWSRNDTLIYKIDSLLIDNNIPYKVSIELGHNSDYPYRNICFLVQENFEDTAFFSISKPYLIADPFGKWDGSGFGALYQLSLSYKDTVFFKGRRNFCIKVVHGMRDEPLNGIEKVGIKIEPVER